MWDIYYQTASYWFDFFSWFALGKSLILFDSNGKLLEFILYQNKYIVWFYILRNYELEFKIQKREDMGEDTNKQCRILLIMVFQYLQVLLVFHILSE